MISGIIGYSHHFGKRRFSDNDAHNLVNFRYFMTVEQVTLILVHICGFLFDLFIGFVLFFDRSRPIGVVFCLSFHLMNSQMFSIGKLVEKLPVPLLNTFILLRYVSIYNDCDNANLLP